MILSTALFSAGCASCGEPEEEPNNDDPNIITEEPEPDAGMADTGTDAGGSTDMGGEVDMPVLPPPPSLELGREELVLRTEQMQQLEAWVLFDGEMFDPEGLTWLSGDESVVTVTAEGLAVAQDVEGTTNIVANATFMESSVEARLPVTVYTPFRSIAAGGEHNCAISQAGSLYCWGDNSAGQGAQSGLTSIVRPTGGANTTEFSRVAAGARHSCAVDFDLAVWCWGENGDGQAGAGGGMLDSPNLVGLSDIEELALGDEFSCAREEASEFFRDLGAIYCWGSNAEGQLGVSSVMTSTEMPVRVDIMGGPTTWRALAAGRSHACGITREGDTYCWGDNRQDQLGPQAGVQQADEPLFVSSDYRSIAAGGTQTCGLKAGGVVECWGTALDGIAPGVTNSADPVVVPAPGDATASRLTVGDGFACAGSLDGTFCWGSNDRGQLGDTSTESRDSAEFVNGAPTFVQLSAGGAHVCALNDTGGAFCWGANDRNQIGDMDDVDRRSPTIVALPVQR